MRLRAGFSRFRFALPFLMPFALVLVLPSSSGAIQAPRYLAKAQWGDSYLQPGGEGQFIISVRNDGNSPGSAPLTIDDTLPIGVTIDSIEWELGSFDLSSYCFGVGTGNLSCTLPASVVEMLTAPPGSGEPGDDQVTGFMPFIYVNVTIDRAASGSGTNAVSVAEGSATPPATDIDQVVFRPEPSPFGIVPGSFQADLLDGAQRSEEPARKAGDHPFELQIAFDLNEATGIDPSDHFRYAIPHGLLADAVVDLPRGVVGDPTAVPECAAVAFAELGPGGVFTRCPPQSQVGYIVIFFSNGSTHRGEGQLAGPGAARIPLYNLKPPAGAPSEFGFNVGGLIQGNIYPQLDPTRNYALQMVLPDLSSLIEVRGVEVTLWGVPGDPAHDHFRYHIDSAGNTAPGTSFNGPIRPLLTNAMDCGVSNGGARIRVDSYDRRGQYTPVEESANPDDVTGCDDPRVRFDPVATLQPTSREAASPTGIDLNIELAQRDGEAGDAAELYAENGYLRGVATPPMRRALIKLPEGMTVSTSVAQGLTGCTLAEVGFGDTGQANCADSSRLGTVEIATPILPAPLEGAVYMAKQSENPFRSLFAVYLVAEGSGIRIKLPVKMDLDPVTGRIALVLDDLPQLPFTDIELRLKTGPRAALRMPDTCGTYAMQYELTSWAGGSPVQGASTYDVERGCGRAPGFQPTFSAGSINGSAGARSEFVLGITRDDREPNLSRLSVTLPAGLAADFASVPLCAPPAAIGDCPSASKVGTVMIAAGAGPSPAWIPEAGGRPAGIYLAGPYKGAPYSLVIVIPAEAGPFDLGAIVERAAVYIDRHSAQAAVRLDPLPQILDGIPLDYRQVRLLIDRPGFVANPTSCEAMSVGGSVVSTDGQIANVQTPFQVADCAALPFRPKLALKVFGNLGRGAHPSLRAVVRSGAHQARIDDATVTLPAGELLDLRRIRTLCARQLLPDRCPQSSRVGYARLRSPFLTEVLHGPIYLREPRGRLPDLAADLRAGQVHILLHGRTAGLAGRLRVRFGGLPDMPLAQASFAFAGGNRGIFVNSEPLCPDVRRARATLIAHSGERRQLRPRLRLHGRC